VLVGDKVANENQATLLAGGSEATIPIILHPL